jgi:hypothetical protein
MVITGREALNKWQLNIYFGVMKINVEVYTSRTGFE